MPLLWLFFFFYLVVYLVYGIFHLFISFGYWKNSNNFSQKPIAISDHLLVQIFQRNMEIARRKALKEQKKKEKEAKMIKPSQLDAEQKEEEELPPIYIPDPPSPLYCGFYSQPNQFWLSMVHTFAKATLVYKLLYAHSRQGHASSSTTQRNHITNVFKRSHWAMADMWCVWLNVKVLF